MRSRARSTSSRTAPGSPIAASSPRASNGFYSSNENGQRGDGGRWGCRIAAGRFRSAAGPNASTTTRRAKTSTRARSRSSTTAASFRRDTIDDNFGFNFNSFPGTVQRAVHADERRGSQLRHGRFVGESVGDRAGRRPRRRSSSSTSAAARTTWAFRTSPIAVLLSGNHAAMEPAATRCRRPTR